MQIPIAAVCDQISSLSVVRQSLRECVEQLKFIFTSRQNILNFLSVRPVN